MFFSIMRHSSAMARASSAVVRLLNTMSTVYASTSCKAERVFGKRQPVHDV